MQTSISMLGSYIHTHTHTYTHIHTHTHTYMCMSIMMAWQLVYAWLYDVSYNQLSSKCPSRTYWKGG